MEGTIVLIKTEKGNMKVKLYDETPLHRDNFIKLVKEGFYNETLFHRVINGFMIQGGDPDSKNSTPDTKLGSGGPGYNIPAEFTSNLIHKKGALAAARLGDQANPEKKSSGSQFYIVQGKPLSDKDLDDLEEQINFQRAQKIFRKIYKETVTEIQKLQSNGKQDEFNDLMVQLGELAWEENEKNPFAYSEEHRKIYTSLGGTPHLDGAYTIFGEVIEGLDIIDSIAAVPTGIADRPIEDVKMEIELLN